MEKKKDRHGEILEAAARHFLRAGFRKTTLEDVARDVGLVKSALYKHFDNKEKLFDAVVDQAAAQYTEIVEAAVRRGRGTKGKLKGALDQALDFIIEQIWSYNPSMENWNELRPYLQRSIARHHRSFEELVEKIVHEGVAAGEICCEEPVMAARVFHLALENIYEKILIEAISVDEGHRYIDFLVKVLIDGLRKRR